MINNKNDYISFITTDDTANGFERKKIKSFDVIFRYLRVLRKLEYAINTKHKLLKIYYQNRLYKLSVKSGISIRPNNFGKGLRIPHYGTIVVNMSARFGDYCVVQCGVNISANVKGGNHIYLGAGCKIMKNVTIADNVIIGANSVVTKDITESNSVWAGIPAKKISENGFKERNVSEL